MRLVKGCTYLRNMGHPDPWGLTPNQVFWHLRMAMETERSRRLWDTASRRWSHPEVDQRAYAAWLESV